MTRFLSLCTLALALSGCVGVDGSHKTYNEPTTGQQLLDLKSALDKGAISQAEYDQKKAQILAKN